MGSAPISPEDDGLRRDVDVLGAPMAYVDVGAGERFAPVTNPKPEGHVEGVGGALARTVVGHTEKWSFGSPTV